MFIVIDGNDCSGKDTQMVLLINWLIEQNKYLQIFKQREPSNVTESGKEINRLSRMKELPDMHVATKLFAQDREELSELRKEILKTSWIVCSRFDYSTYVYQGTQGMTFEEVASCHNYENILLPNVTFYIRVSEEEILRRLSGRDEESREAFEQTEFLLGTNRKYEEIMTHFSETRNIVTIDGDQSIEGVAKEIQKYFEGKVEGRR